MWMGRLIRNILVSLFFLFYLSVFSQTITGKVVGVTDGDTFKLLEKDSILHRVRVANIDCPEKGQPFGKKAKQFSSKALYLKTIQITVLNTDRYGRLIAFAFYDDDLNLSQELVRNGLAWNYDQYSDDAILIDLQKEAKKNKLGLWIDKNPVPPWEWRKGRRK